MLNSDGPCRAASVRFVVWQVPHCCLNSVAPSGGFDAGKGICANAICVTSTVPHTPSPAARSRSPCGPHFAICFPPQHDSRANAERVFGEVVLDQKPKHDDDPTRSHCALACTDCKSRKTGGGSSGLFRGREQKAAL